MTNSENLFEAREKTTRDYADELSSRKTGDFSDGASFAETPDFASPSAKTPPKGKRLRAGTSPDARIERESSASEPPAQDRLVDPENDWAVEEASVVDEIDVSGDATVSDLGTPPENGVPRNGVRASTKGRVASFAKGKAAQAAENVLSAAAGDLDDRSVESDLVENSPRKARRTYQAGRRLRSLYSSARSSPGRAAAAKARAAAKAAPAHAVRTFVAGGASKAKGVAAAAVLPKTPLGWIAAVGATVLLLFSCLFLFMCSGGDDDADLAGLTADEAAVARWLLDAGFSKESAAAMLGNIANEGGFDPSTWEVNNDGVGFYPYERAFGMFQYTSTSPGTGLYSSFKTWCSEQGKDPYAHESSLEFTFVPGTGGYFESSWSGSLASSGYYSNCPGYDRVDGPAYSASELKEADSVSRATYSWMACYERCANGPYAHLDRRLDSAERYYSILCGSGGGGIASVGDLMWPSDEGRWLTYSGHYGLDIQAAYGTPIYAPADGTVIWGGASWESTYGNVVRIHHDGLGLQTACAHMSRTTVNTGDRVEKGDIIGYVGSTGNSTGPHIHFEIYERDEPTIGGDPIFDDMSKWALYFDIVTLESNRVS